MTTYEAIIKVPVQASNDEKVKQIRMGLHEIAARLVSEYEQPADDVADWCGEMSDIAYEEEAAMRDA